jgi:hypothetical protein
VATNAFGNVVVRAGDGGYWRICPEHLSCELIARSALDFNALWNTEEFQRDWRMTRLIETASASLGPVNDERCYCLKIPAVLGGAYEASNFGTMERLELVAFAGSLAHQIKDIPDGAQVKLTPRE